MGFLPSTARRAVPRRGRSTQTASAGIVGVVLIATVLCAVAPSLLAQTASSGRSLGVTLGLGSQGSLSYVEAGVVLPKIGGSFSIELKARAMSSLTWVPTLDSSLSPSAFHPVAVGGVVSLGGCSPMFQGFFRAHGATELFLGYTFTPYDSAIYQIPNLIGPNLTFAILGYFGVEMFTGSRSSIFIDAGGGYKNFIVDAARKTDPYVVAASWIGSGFGIRMGTKLYF